MGIAYPYSCQLRHHLPIAATSNTEERYFYTAQQSANYPSALHTPFASRAQALPSKPTFYHETHRNGAPLCFFLWPLESPPRKSVLALPLFPAHLQQPNSLFPTAAKYRYIPDALLPLADADTTQLALRLALSLLPILTILLRPPSRSQRTVCYYRLRNTCRPPPAPPQHCSW